MLYVDIALIPNIASYDSWSEVCTFHFESEQGKENTIGQLAKLAGVPEGFLALVSLAASATVSTVPLP